jgi:hypothetical protein
MLVLKFITPIFRREIIFFIAISFYRYIVCQNCSCDASLRGDKNLCEKKFLERKILNFLFNSFEIFDVKY